MAGSESEAARVWYGAIPWAAVQYCLEAECIPVTLSHRERWGLRLTAHDAMVRMNMFERGKANKGNTMIFKVEFTPEGWSHYQQEQFPGYYGRSLYKALYVREDGVLHFWQDIPLLELEKMKVTFQRIE